MARAPQRVRRSNRDPDRVRGALGRRAKRALRQPAPLFHFSRDRSGPRTTGDRRAIFLACAAALDVAHVPHHRGSPPCALPVGRNFLGFAPASHAVLSESRGRIAEFAWRSEPPFQQHLALAVAPSFRISARRYYRPDFWCLYRLVPFCSLLGNAPAEGGRSD